MFQEDLIIQWFTNYAYDPLLVYCLVVALMFGSSFGLPVPEEVTLISVGILAFIGANPDRFPPPEGASVVDPITAAIVCTIAVFLSDFLVFSLGRFFETNVRKINYFKKWIEGRAFQRVSLKVQKHGSIMAAVFRFTPGLRFPGHFACGMMGVKLSRFILADGIAVLISVPTQVLFIAFYGEIIIYYLNRFKYYVFFALGLGLLFYIINYYWTRSKIRSS